jgi:hypothetical protein
MGHADTPSFPQTPQQIVKENILVKARRLLLKEKNSPSAVTGLVAATFSVTARF